MNADTSPAIAPRATLATLMLAVFTVSIGYGIVLPLLPYLIERLLGPEVASASVSRHTGLLTGAYALALFLFAPRWGGASDRFGRRNILLLGLLGFSVTMFVSSFTEGLPMIYVERILSGAFAAAVTPVAAAAVSEFAPSDHVRARRLAFVSMAGMTGFLLGPMFSVFISRLAAEFVTTVQPTGSLRFPLAMTAGLALVVSVAAAFAIPRARSAERRGKGPLASVRANGWLVARLLALTSIVSMGIGVFEVGLALRGKQELGLAPYQIAMMFSECSLVMFVVQAIVFSPGFKPALSRWVIAPALATLAAGLAFVPWASDFALMLAVVAAVAASAGILSPVLTYWISSKAGNAQGWELGKQTAAASLGVTIGSAAGGLFFDVTALPGASFFIAAALAALGLLLSLRLPHLLVTGARSERARVNPNLDDQRRTGDPDAEATDQTRSA